MGIKTSFGTAPSNPMNPLNVIRAIKIALDGDLNFWSLVSSLNALYFRGEQASGRPLDFIKLDFPSFEETKLLFESAYESIRSQQNTKLKAEELDALLFCCSSHFRPLSSLFDLLHVGFEGDMMEILGKISGTDGEISKDLIRLCLIGEPISPTLEVHDNDGQAKPFVLFMQDGGVLGLQIKDRFVHNTPDVIPVISIVKLWQWTQAKSRTGRESFTGAVHTMIEQTIRLIARDRTREGFGKFHAAFLTVWSQAFPLLSPKYNGYYQFIMHPLSAKKEIFLQEDLVRIRFLLKILIFYNHILQVAISNCPAIHLWKSCRSNGELLGIALVSSLTKYGIFDPRIAPEVFPSKNEKSCLQLFHFTDVTDLETLEKRPTAAAAQQLISFLQQKSKNAKLQFIVFAWKQIFDETDQKFVHKVQELADREVTTIVCDKKSLVRMYGPSFHNLEWFMEKIADPQTTQIKRAREDDFPLKSSKKQKTGHKIG